MAAVLTERLVDVARAAASAGWGQKTAIYEAAAVELGMSPQTLIRKLRTVSVTKPRKQRADAGQVALTRDEALVIAATVEETRRLTGSGTIPLEDAVAHLRANGKINAGRVDEETGEFLPLSLSAIRCALRQYRLHPDQLAAPTPAASLSSPHPNWSWQIDASVSRQFYLADDGARVMSKAEFYRGKPQNFERISDRRLWRYLITDHASGCQDGLYVLGSETTVNLLDALMHVMCERPGVAMHGVPKILVTDPGSAMTASATQNFCDALNIELIINKTGNARAKGQVENAHWLCEQHFEAPLKLQAPVTSLDQINGMFGIFNRTWNATRIHTRTGMTRRDGWLRITEDQLIIAPAIEILRSLATSSPKTCTAKDYQIRFKGKRYDVSGVPGVINGQKLDVIRNPFDPDTVRVLLIGENGHRTHILAPQIQTDDWGFVTTAAQIGTNYATPPETEVDANRKAIERIAMQADTDAEAAAARKAKKVAFGGEIDPQKIAREANVVQHMPRRGTPAEIDAPTEQQPMPRIEPPRFIAEAPKLNTIEAAMRIKTIVEHLGGTWSADLVQKIESLYGGSVPSDQLDEIAAQLLGATKQRTLRAINGGAA
jgi:hypothetical protein